MFVLPSQSVNIKLEILFGLIGALLLLEVLEEVQGTVHPHHRQKDEQPKNPLAKVRSKIRSTRTLENRYSHVSFSFLRTRLSE
jgi:hypothetical protein